MTTLAAKPQTPSRSPSGKPAHLTTYLSALYLPLSISLSFSLSFSLLRTHIFSLPACIAFRFDSFSVLLLYMFYTAVLLLPGASLSPSLPLTPCPSPSPSRLARWGTSALLHCKCRNSLDASAVHRSESGRAKCTHIAATSCGKCRHLVPLISATVSISNIIWVEQISI